MKQNFSFIWTKIDFFCGEVFVGKKYYFSKQLSLCLKIR